MKNVTFEKVKNSLIITVDLSQEGSRSKSGKTNIIASTQGFVAVDDEVSVGLNVVRKV